MSVAALLAILTLWTAAAPVAHAAEHDAGDHAPDGYLEPSPAIVDGRSHA